MKKHHYKLQIEWTGNEGNGTQNYKSYSRNYNISGIGKSNVIKGSSDPSFLGDKEKYNPEDMFLSSLSACHMLWFLHLCSINEVIVTSYLDEATAVMEEAKNGSGRFTEVTLNPKVKVTENSMISKVDNLHEEAGMKCFIANSCNFEIKYKPTTTIA